MRTDEWKEKIEEVVPDLFEVTSLEPNNCESSVVTH